MKIIKNTKEAFKPFSITITIESEKEYKGLKEDINGFIESGEPYNDLFDLFEILRNEL